MAANKGGRITTNTEVALRVDEVLRLRLDGAQLHDLVQYAAEQNWDVCSRQIKRYITAADKLLAARIEKDRGKLFARALSQREALFARCINAADYSTAARVLRDRDALLNLYPQETKGATPNGPPIQINLFQRVEDLAQQLRSRVDAGIQGSPLLIDRSGESLDTASAHPEADRVSATG